MDSYGLTDWFFTLFDYKSLLFSLLVSFSYIRQIRFDFNFIQLTHLIHLEIRGWTRKPLYLQSNSLGEKSNKCNRGRSWDIEGFSSRRERRVHLTRGGDGFSKAMCLGEKVPNFSWKESWPSRKRKLQTSGHGGGRTRSYICLEFQESDRRWMRLSWSGRLAEEPTLHIWGPHTGTPVTPRFHCPLSGREQGGMGSDFRGSVLTPFS